MAREESREDEIRKEREDAARPRFVWRGLPDGASQWDYGNARVGFRRVVATIPGAKKIGGVWQSDPRGRVGSMFPGTIYLMAPADDNFTINAPHLGGIGTVWPHGGTVVYEMRDGGIIEVWQAKRRGRPYLGRTSEPALVEVVTRVEGVTLRTVKTKSD